MRLLVALLGLSCLEAHAQKTFRRAVPDHPIAVLDGCSPDSIGLVARTIDAAISVGAPAYNEGRLEDCFRTYERTAVALAAKLEGCEQVKAALDAGRTRAATFPTFKDKAWAMRDAFDGLLGVVVKWANRPRPQIPSRPRLPQKHPVTILDDCPKAGREQIESDLADAISLGAPAFNEGDAETCFKIYEQAALGVDRRLTTCQGLRKALVAGTKDAAAVKSFTDKSWVMRDAFDGVLEVITRKPASVGRERSIPDYDVKILEQCSAESIARTTTAIQEAIALGAPLFDAGAVAACHTVYKKAAADLRRTLVGCPGVKEALRAGSADAKNYPSDADKAWAMRDAFDGLLQLFAKKPRR